MFLIIIIIINILYINMQYAYYVCDLWIPQPLNRYWWYLYLVIVIHRLLFITKFNPKILARSVGEGGIHDYPRHHIIFSLTDVESSWNKIIYGCTLLYTIAQINVITRIIVIIKINDRSKMLTILTQFV